METLLEYVENSGDMKLTAQKMFQHSNTIRYRINKIRKLLGLEDDAHSLAQLYVFARLRRIYQDLL
jgi:DNA-binding PucR family transcriptional regulator